MQTITWKNESETEKTAKQLAQLLEAGDVICLEGDLGAGKTTFTRYLARALGIEGNIKSPTFTIMREYQSGHLPLYHMDAYRLEQTGAEGLGIEEYLEGDGVCVIEWPQYIKEDLEGDYLWISIEKQGPEGRILSLTGRGKRGEELVEGLIGGMAK